MSFCAVFFPAPRDRGWMVLLLLCQLLTSDMMGAESPPASPRQQRVLLLYSSQQFVPGNVATDEAIRAGFAEGSKLPIEFYAEFLDFERFSGEFQQDRARDFLRDKYSDRLPDLVIARGRTAVAFIAKFRATLFHLVPVVYCGVPPEDLPESFPDNRIVGAIHITDNVGTLELALRLQPDTRQVAIVPGHNFMSEEEYASFKRRVTFVHLSTHSLADLSRELSTLPDHTIVLYHPFFRDAAGNTFTPRDVLDRIAPASRVPIYGFFDTFIGHGIVGGSIVTFNDVGRAAARIGLRILQGEEPKMAALTETERAVPIFDWQQLRRWKISEGALPPGSIVRFRSPSVWEEYRWRILGVLGLCVAQAFLIGALLVQRRLRRTASREAKKTRGELLHVTRVATMAELGPALAHELNQPLGAILQNAETAETMLSRPDPNLDELREILSDIRRDDERAASIIRGHRALARKHAHDAKPLKLENLLTETMAVMKMENASQQIRVQLEVEKDLPEIRGDYVHLQQAMLNLMLNARDAMKDVAPKARKLSVQAHRNGDDTIEVAVTDTGQGIPTHQVTQIFDSFFTTKTDGLGMGLAISNLIIVSHGGRLWAENNADGGATFRFTLPLAVMVSN